MSVRKVVVASISPGGDERQRDPVDYPRQARAYDDDMRLAFHPLARGSREAQPATSSRTRHSRRSTASSGPWSARLGLDDQRIGDQAAEAAAADVGGGIERIGIAAMAGDAVPALGAAPAETKNSGPIEATSSHGTHSAGPVFGGQFHGDHRRSVQAKVPPPAAPREKNRRLWPAAAPGRANV